MQYIAIFLAISEALNLIFTKGLNQKKFILGYLPVDLEDLFKIDKLNAESSTKMYLDKINMLLHAYASLKRINKHKLKFKSKPWITLGSKRSTSAKNKLLTHFINENNHVLKEEFHSNYRKYRNSLSTLMKKFNKSITINILKQFGVILRIHREESNPLFL